MVLLLFLSASASTWVVDGTSLAIHYGTAPVTRAVRCAAPPASAPQLRGQALNTLGVAVVAYSKKQGTMTWGHASLRAIYCLDQQLVDVEYEVYRLSAWNEVHLREEHQGETFAAGPWPTTQRGKKVLFRNVDPVDGGWFADAQAGNREIYEVWLDLNQQELDGIVRAVEAAWAAQLRTMRAEDDLPKRFRWVADNCTSIFADVLPARLWTGRPFTPFAWVRRLEVQAALKVLHPSHHLVRRWRGELPSASRRKHPVLRLRRALRRRELGPLRADLAQARPALPFEGRGASPSVLRAQGDGDEVGVGQDVVFGEQDGS